MTVIRQQDFIDSIEDALQFISYYHPLDYVKAVEEAYKKEKSQAAKDDGLHCAPAKGHRGQYRN